MSFYPILRVPGFHASVTLYNYSPNNFECSQSRYRHAYVSWANGKYWTNQQIGTLGPGESFVISQNDLPALVPAESQPFVFICNDILSHQTSNIGKIETPCTSLPAWRATISLEFKDISKTSYQGEIDPFPESGTCLTFNYLTQQDSTIETWLIALNLIKPPLLKQAEIKFFDPAHSPAPIHQELMHTNGINSFLLPQDISQNENIVITCEESSFVPLFFSHNQDRTQLSLEHTHPPASSAIYGDRFKAQKIIKHNWMSHLSNGKASE